MRHLRAGDDPGRPGIIEVPGRQREFYLPAGSTWTGARQTDRTIRGGQTITADAPLERIFLYLRDGVGSLVRSALEG